MHLGRNSTGNRWLVDRSRYLRGLAYCQMARYLEYHAGPHGYGFRKKGTPFFIGTGSLAHSALEAILKRAKETGEAPPAEFVERLLEGLVSSYKATVAKEGYLGLPDSDVQRAIQEQVHLFQALIWGWWKVVLPGLLRDFELVAIEQEFELEHKGVVIMTRPDLVLRSRETGKLRIRDFKTAGSISDQYIKEYQESVQMAVSCLAAESVLGEPVSLYELDVLLKGDRRRDYNPEEGDYTGPRRQNSPLCYAYRRPGSPPLQEEDWQPKWRYKGVDGKNHVLGRAYRKEPIWETFSAKAWVEKLGPAVAESYLLIGPYHRQDVLLRHFMEEISASELAVVDKLWSLYDLEEQHGWASEEFQVALSRAFPRSYNCHDDFGHTCQFYDICFRRDGWQDPLGTGLFVPRRPHHEPERQQMEERGIPIPPPEFEAPE